MIELKLLQNIIYDSLQSLLYDASLVGYQFALEDHYSGLNLEVLGLNDKIGIVLETVMKAIINFHPSEDEFIAAKEEIKLEMLDELSDIKN